MFRSKALSKLAMAVTAPVVAATLVLLGAPQVALAARPIPVVMSFSATKTSITNTVARSSSRQCSGTRLHVRSPFHQA